MRPELILWLLVTVGVFLGAASASRAYVANPIVLTLLGALALYTIGNLMMLKLMRETGMGIAISISAIGQLVLVNLVAMGVFGERPSGTQMAGIALGVVAMALILWPAAERS
jgi:glucose uptake protein